MKKNYNSKKCKRKITRKFRVFIPLLFLFFSAPIVMGQTINDESVAGNYDVKKSVNLNDLNISVNFQDIPLDDAILMIGQKSGVTINYNARWFSDKEAVSYVGSNVSMANILEAILPENISYVTVRNIVLLQKDDPTVVIPNRTIYGTITDSDGNPMPGANVVVMGTNIGSVTDENGYYEIDIANEATLIFSMIGFESKEVNTRTLEQDELNIVLSVQTVGMEELVVLGYSEVQAQHVASSVSTVDIDRVKSGPVAKLQEVFSGTLPGVSLMQGSNLPGHVPGTIQIRGISTLQGEAPLVIVDGMEQSLTDIDPNQVRSITVLKDAASASMYGSRGANGVILIETERGISDRFSVDVHTWTAMHNPIDLPEFVDAADFMTLRNEARSIQGQSLQYTQEDISAARSGQTPSIDWMDTIMQRTAYSHNTSANISGGGGVGTFNLMLGYNQEGGLNSYEGTNKFSTRFNTNINIADRFVLMADFYAHRLQVDRLHANSDGHGLYRAAWRMNPTQAIFYDDTDIDDHYVLHNNMNPLASIDYGGIRNNLYDRSTINLRPRFNVNENFHISGNVSYMINKSANKYERRNFRFFDAEGVPVQNWGNSVGASQGVSASQFTARMLAQYVAELRQGKDDVYITGGTEMMSHTYTDYREISKSSFFGKINYSFDNRYILEFTGRADGSSKFAPGHRWGFFPSGALAWNAHNEQFISGLTESGILNELKFRVSYGLIGNENVAPYLWQEIVDNWGWTKRVPNPGFSWEKQRQANVGVDVTTLDNRLNMTFETYIKQSYDLIYDQFAVPPLTGSKSLESAVNIGEVENRGWELSADWSDNIGDFRYRVGGMVFDNKNKMLKAGYAASDTLIFKGDTDRVWYKGIPINNYYGFESDGYFQSQAEIDEAGAVLPNTLPGDIRYIDQNGDGIINDQDRIYLGNPLPRYNYAVNLNLWYKGWDFTLVGQGVGKRTGRLNGQEGYPVYVDGGGNDMGAPRQYYMDNRWSQSTPDSRFPRVWTGTSPNTLLNDVWLSDASYFRIKTIELGYTFPTVGNSFRNLRVYLNAQDLFTITNWEGLEPERNGGNGNYPRTSRFSIGVRASIN